MKNIYERFEEIMVSISVMLPPDGLHLTDRLRDIVDQMVYESYLDGGSEGISQERGQRYE